MHTRLSKWRAIALCCVPAIILAVIVGIGFAISGTILGTFFSGPLALGLIVLALLICPLHMGWMMWRMQKRRGVVKSSSRQAGCCLPEEQTSTFQLDSPDRLQALRVQRQALQQEVAALQQARQHEGEIGY